MVDYIEKVNDIAIGGKQFSGARTDQQIEVVSSTFTMAAGATKTISLANYLPNDGYDYYVTIEGYCNTGTTSGNTADMQIHGGTGTGNGFYRRLCRVVTRHSSYQWNGGSMEIPILRSDRAFTIFNGDGSGTSGNMLVRLTSYRRMGKNDSLANRVEKVTTPDGTYTFGGNVVDGNYKKIEATLWSGTAIAASNGTKSFDLSTLIPKDGYEYEGLFSVSTGSASTNNQNISLWIGNQRMVSYRTKSAANYTGGGNAWIKIPTSRSITVTNGGGIATTSTALRLSYVRRIGTNSDSGTYHSYECIPSSTLQPNVLVYGSPTISSGVVSNFSASNYVEIPYSRVEGVYVVKFTMPTTTSTAVQSILHSDYFINLCVAENSYDVYMYKRQDNSRVSLFTATAGATYWVKIEFSLTTKYVSYSTDGVNYSSGVSVADSTVNSSLQYPILLGMSSSMAPTQYFLGSIDLNGCYIYVGSKVWEGMSYGKLLPIGGEGFDGEWHTTKPYTTVFSGATIAGNGSKSSEVSNYLPDNDNVYEVLVSGYVRTGNSSGNAANVWVRSDFQGSAQCIVGYCVTRTSSNYADAKSGTILCKQNSSGKMTIYTTNTASATTGNCGVLLGGYRRIGTNGG